MEDKLKQINFKYKQIKFWRILNIFLASVLTLVGTVSIMSLLICLNQIFGVSYFSCFLLTLILSQGYSSVVNSKLNCIDNKIKSGLEEIKKLEEECEYEKSLSDELVIQSIELRFEGLSKENKLKLLNYIKNNIPLDKRDEQLKILEDSDALFLLKEMENSTNDRDGYSRKRIITEEIKK